MKKVLILLCISLWSLITPRAYAQLFVRDTSFLPAWKQTLRFPYSPGFTVANIIFLPDGRLLLGGIFSAGVLQGFPQNHYKSVVRLFPDGTIDGTLASNWGIGSGVVKFENNLITTGPFDAMRLSVADSSGNFIPDYIPDSIRFQYAGQCFNYYFYSDGRIL